MSYNKSEKHTYSPDNDENYKTLRGGWKGIAWFLLFSGLATASFVKEEKYFCGVVLLGMAIIYLLHYTFGKLRYNDTHFHYTGFCGFFWLKKVDLNLPFSDITEVNVTSKCRGSYRGIRQYDEYLTITTNDNEEHKLNAEYFTHKELIEIMQNGLLNNQSSAFVLPSEKYTINIYNENTKRLNSYGLRIYINEECITTKEAQLSLDVQTGDVVTFRRYSDAHMFRLLDPTRTEYHLENTNERFFVDARKKPIVKL